MLKILLGLLVVFSIIQLNHGEHGKDVDHHSHVYVERSGYSYPFGMNRVSPVSRDVFYSIKYNVKHLATQLLHGTTDNVDEAIEIAEDLVNALSQLNENGPIELPGLQLVDEAASNAVFDTFGDLELFIMKISALGLKFLESNTFVPTDEELGDLNSQISSLSRTLKSLFNERHQSKLALDGQYRSYVHLVRKRVSANHCIRQVNAELTKRAVTTKLGKIQLQFATDVEPSVELVSPDLLEISSGLRVVGAFVATILFESPSDELLARLETELKTQIAMLNTKVMSFDVLPKQINSAYRANDVTCVFYGLLASTLTTGLRMIAEAGVPIEEELFMFISGNAIFSTEPFQRVIKIHTTQIMIAASLMSAIRKNDPLTTEQIVSFNDAIANLDEMINSDNKTPFRLSPEEYSSLPKLYLGHDYVNFLIGFLNRMIGKTALLNSKVNPIQNKLDYHVDFELQQ